MDRDLLWIQVYINTTGFSFIPEVAVFKLSVGRLRLPAKWGLEPVAECCPVCFDEIPTMSVELNLILTLNSYIV